MAEGCGHATAERRHDDRMTQTKQTGRRLTGKVVFLARKDTRRTPAEHPPPFLTTPQHTRSLPATHPPLAHSLPTASPPPAHRLPIACPCPSLAHPAAFLCPSQPPKHTAKHTEMIVKTLFFSKIRCVLTMETGPKLYCKRTTEALGPQPQAGERAREAAPMPWKQRAQAMAWKQGSARARRQERGSRQTGHSPSTSSEGSESRTRRPDRKAIHAEGEGTPEGGSAAIVGVGRGEEVGEEVGEKRRRELCPVGSRLLVKRQERTA